MKLGILHKFLKAAFLLLGMFCVVAGGLLFFLENDHPEIPVLLLLVALPSIAGWYLCVRLTATLEEAALINRAAASGGEASRPRYPGQLDASAILDEIAYTTVQLGRQSDVHREIVEAVSDAIIIFSPDRTIRFANSRALQLFSAKTGDLECAPFDLVLPGVGPTADAAVAAIEGGSESYSEQCTVSISGRRMDLQLTFRPIGYPRPEDRAMITIIQDVTTYRQTLRDLTLARDAAEVANKSKGLFLAKMSHEIRTPMNGILGMTDLLLEGSLSREQRRYLEMVKFSANGLLNIVNDILDLSKIEAGKLELNPQPFVFRDHILTFSEIMHVRAQQRGLQFVVQLEESVPDLVVGDANRLAQVLINLIQNAIKFTFNGGGIVLLIWCESRNEREARVKFAVIDSGIGIPKHKLQAIFDPFTQADVATTGRFGGTGLGLSIVSDLVRLMGGRLNVRSREGIGSVFSFDLNMRLPESSDKIGTERRSGLERLRAFDSDNERPHILLVEDNSVNQLLASRLLEREGYRVSVAGNGRIALKKLEVGGFDLVLMDCQMPEMDGFETTRLIREGERGTNRRLPIVAVTAHAMSGDRQRCLEAGMDDYVTKPIKKELLFNAIERNLERSE